jgi:D-sedoheptulose 7-phosphate isomerase
MENRVRYLFGASIENRIAAADVLSDVISQASARLVHCLLNNGKIFICGQGASAANGLHFSTALLNHFEIERPALPVIALTSDPALLTVFGQEGHAEHIFARQIQALGQAEDVLIVLSTTGHAVSLLNAVHAAHERGMQVVVLSGRDGGVLVNHLSSEDIELRVPGETAALIRETHLFILHCFCDLIEQSLFGQVLG